MICEPNFKHIKQSQATAAAGGKTVANGTSAVEPPCENPVLSKTALAKQNGNGIHRVSCQSALALR